ncbi:hypothetical protein V6305_09240 [Serratia marcescens]|uniref:hypothetical protein n=1 Tax=Serratia marcescens TaxID=615 RepID=UPI00370176DD
MDNKSELSKPATLNGWRVTVTRTGDRQGVASISGPGVFCMEVPVEYSMLDFMEALAVQGIPNARIDGVKEFSAEMLARADDNSSPEDVRAGMRTAAAFANMFIELREVRHG